MAGSSCTLPTPTISGNAYLSLGFRTRNESTKKLRFSRQSWIARWLASVGSSLYYTTKDWTSGQADQEAFEFVGYNLVRTDRPHFLISKLVSIHQHIWLHLVILTCVATWTLALPILSPSFNFLRVQRIQIISPEFEYSDMRISKITVSTASIHRSGSQYLWALS
jgi:hypothetical protein